MANKKFILFFSLLGFISSIFSLIVLFFMLYEFLFGVLNVSNYSFLPFLVFTNIVSYEIVFSLSSNENKNNSK